MSLNLTIADLKERARRRVPKMFFDYADSGAFTESTYRANEEDFAKIKLRQRVLVDMTNRSLESTMIGEKVSMPVALAPTGLTGMQHPDGEMLAAQAAEEFGVPFTLSARSSTQRSIFMRIVGHRSARFSPWSWTAGYMTSPMRMATASTSSRLRATARSVRTSPSCSTERIAAACSARCESAAVRGRPSSPTSR